MSYKFLTPVLFISMAILHMQASAQTGDPNLYSEHIYFNQNEFLQHFEKKADAIIKRGGFLKAEQAEAQLASSQGKQVSIASVHPSKKVLKPTQIHDKIKESTVLFGSAYNCGNCHLTHINVASGYVIDASGLCVTNYHVIESYAKGKDKNLSLQIMTADGKAYPVTEVVSASKAADLAIVKVNTNGDALKPLALGDPAEVGDEVYVLSHPNNMLYYFSQGIVARNYMMDDRNPKTPLMPEMEITADYAAGSSGAPIVDNKGNLVSTVSTTRSIYYHPQEKKDLQMVVKGTKPVVLLKRMLK